MADNEQRRTRIKAWAAEIDAARRRTGFALPEGLTSSAHRFRRLVAQWAVAEVAPGRLLPWLPVAFGFGIILYFTADREPAWWAAISATLAGSMVAFLARRSAIGFPLALGLAAIAAGFAVATLQAARVAHPVLQYPVASGSLTGFIEVREARERSDRVILRVQHLEGRRTAEALERVRLAIRKDTAPPVGSFVEPKARRRRSRRCARAAMTSRATCISSASALPAMHSARSRS